MEEVIETTKWRCLSTITVRYDGNDATSHEIDLNQLGESIQGLARIFALCSNVLLTGRFGEHLDETAVRVVCSPVAEHRCFEVLAMVKGMATSKELWSGAFGAVLAVVVQFVLSRRDQEKMKYLNEALQKSLQQNPEHTKYLHEALQKSMQQNQQNVEMFRTSIEQMLGRFDHMIDKLAAVLRPSVRRALTPIGQSCERIELYADGEQIIALGSEHKHAFADIGAIDSEDLTHFAGVISEFDMATGICKITLHGETTRIPAIVIDPMFKRPNNRYVRAMASADSIRFLAKADRDALGQPLRLYISESSEHEGNRVTD
jgi:methyl-accepting chemotaxis protein